MIFIDGVIWSMQIRDDRLAQSFIESALARILGERRLHPFRSDSHPPDTEETALSKLAILSLEEPRAHRPHHHRGGGVRRARAHELKQELIPSLELPALVVMTTYPGASPEVVENDVSTPVEAAIQGVPGLESTTATSTTNASIVQAMFAYGTNLATAEQKIQQAINRISSQLPEDVSPQVLSVSIDDFPVIQVAVHGFRGCRERPGRARVRRDPRTRRRRRRQRRRDRRRGRAAHQHHPPTSRRLAAVGTSTTAISDAPEAERHALPRGDITENGRRSPCRPGRRSPRSRRSPRFRWSAPMPRSAMWRRSCRSPTPSPSISRVDGKDALSISITKLPAANTVEVSNGVIAALDTIGEAFPRRPVHGDLRPGAVSSCSRSRRSPPRVFSAWSSLCS